MVRKVAQSTLTAFRATILLLSFGVVASWAASYYGFHYVTVTLPNGAVLSLQASAGVASVGWIAHGVTTSDTSHVTSGVGPPHPLLLAEDFWAARGFSWVFDGRVGGRIAMVMSPHWLVLGIVVLPIIVQFAVLQLRRRRRMRRGLCPHCGYDLRGVAGRCPECGGPAPAARPPPAPTDPPA
jgi:hypothetical protein